MASTNESSLAQVESVTCRLFSANSLLIQEWSICVYIKRMSCMFCQVCLLRYSQLSQLSFMQYMGGGGGWWGGWVVGVVVVVGVGGWGVLCVFQLTVSLVMTVRICVRYLITIYHHHIANMNYITHCLGLDNERVVSVLCFSMILSHLGCIYHVTAMIPPLLHRKCLVAVGRPETEGPWHKDAAF